MTANTTHLFRLARWGITLARRRALLGIEEDLNAPAPVRRLARLARLATLTGKSGPRDYAGAFRAIGPAAIKLGQSLATRPDLVGEEAARNLLRSSSGPAGVSLRRSAPQGCSRRSAAIGP